MNAFSRVFCYSLETKEKNHGEEKYLEVPKLIYSLTKTSILIQDIIFIRRVDKYGDKYRCK